MFSTLQHLRTSQIITTLILLFSSTIQAQQNEHITAIQLAVVLDTSNSMDGLIDQTRSQLWTMIDELNKAEKHNKPVNLEVAILEYGNSHLSKRNGYTRIVTDFTSDLDLVSEALFELKTNGGEEYCGYAIKTSVRELDWSTSQEDLKLLYIAGNEPFTQGPVNYEKAITLATADNITVSTIFAGSHSEGIATGWQRGSLLAGGNYMSIDQNQQIVHIDAPQDRLIYELNTKLNDTYIPYGTKGKQAKIRQLTQDQANNSMSPSMLAKRAKSKSSKAYKASSWDMVDALEDEKFDIDLIKDTDLPKTLIGKSKTEKLDYLMTKKQEREIIKQEIFTLSKEREAYVSSERKKSAKRSDNTVNDVLINSIKQQADKQGFKIR